MVIWVLLNNDNRLIVLVHCGKSNQPIVGLVTKYAPAETLGIKSKLHPQP